MFWYIVLPQLRVQQYAQDNIPATGYTKCHTEAMEQSFPGWQRFILCIYCSSNTHRYAAAYQPNLMARNTEQSISDKHFPTWGLPAAQFGPHVSFVNPWEDRSLNLKRFYNHMQEKTSSSAGILGIKSLQRCILLAMLKQKQRGLSSHK
jgi:hypothetical protein